jgi:DNA-binding NarL/FixJ family response regulator
MNEIKPVKQIIRVMVADKNPLFRHGLTLILKTIPDLRPVAEASDTFETSRKIKDLKPDVVLLGDFSAADDSLKMCAWIREHYPETRTIIVTEFPEMDHLIDALEAGAAAFLVKGRLNIESIVESIKSAASVQPLTGFSKS